MSKAKPMSKNRRIANYLDQTSATELTAAQRRRVEHKARAAAKRKVKK